MEVDQYFDDNCSRGDKPTPENWNSVSNSATESDQNPSFNFDCNICLDPVQDPVVTLCGHLYCWPCIYKWLQFQRRSSDEDQKQPQCPVCKAEVSRTTLVPLYGKGRSSNPPNIGITIPPRPLSPVCGPDTPRPSPSTPQFQRTYSYSPNTYYSSQQNGYLSSSMVNLSGTASNLLDPMIGMFGEMIYDRASGNSITNMYSYSNSYNLVGRTRMRRHEMQADKSLCRICFFLFCCVLSCLLLF